jgi:aminocarboxymuconate-semialdehyde decarboxylase
MRIIDAHFHWYPQAVLEELFRRRNQYLGIDSTTMLWRDEDGGAQFNADFNWFDLDDQLGHMDGLGHNIDVVCSIGPYSAYFSELPLEVGRDIALQWNEAVAETQRKYSGRFWGTAAVPLLDTNISIEVMEHAVKKLGLVGINLPGSVGSTGRIDAAYLEPFYARAEELDVPLFLHATDIAFQTVLDGYNGALFASFGRVVDVSVAACRLVLSGVMERYPKLKIFMSHCGGALPYQSGRMDKNSKAAKLPRPVSSYIKRMYTDTVMPHAQGMKFAIEYYGADHVIYGTDYPCWSPASALELLDQIGLSDTDQEKVLNANARRVFGLRGPDERKPSSEAPMLASV